MKKASLFLLASCLVSQITFAQSWSGYGGTNIYTTANVGIGTGPSTLLNVVGGGAVFGNYATLTNYDGQLSLGNQLYNYAPTQSNWAQASTLILSSSGTATIAFHTSQDGVSYISGSRERINIGYDGGWGAATVGLPNGVWTSGGNVGIGTQNPGSFALAVNGTMHARQINVDVTGWSDFVFKPAYKMLSLPDLNKYIKANSHLPNVPSEAEAMANGVDVAQMNKVLLQKVEELTLYLIEKDKQYEGLSRKLAAQQREIKRLKNKVNKF